MKIQIKDTVKYREPIGDEKNLVFTIVNINEVTNRCLIQLVCNNPIKPTFLESIDNLTKI